MKTSYQRPAGDENGLIEVAARDCFDGQNIRLPSVELLGDLQQRLLRVTNTILAKAVETDIEGLIAVDFQKYPAYWGEFLHGPLEGAPDTGDKLGNIYFPRIALVTDLGNNFITAEVTDNSAMFRYDGKLALTLLEESLVSLKTAFDSSASNFAPLHKAADDIALDLSQGILRIYLPGHLYTTPVNAGAPAQ